MREQFVERERQEFGGQCAATQAGRDLVAQQARGRTCHHHVQVALREQATDELLPAGHFLNLIEEEPAPASASRRANTFCQRRPAWQVVSFSEGNVVKIVSFYFGNGARNPAGACSRASPARRRPPSANPC
jgi:hypothetical protein